MKSLELLRTFAAIVAIVGVFVTFIMAWMARRIAEVLLFYFFWVCFYALFVALISKRKWEGDGNG